MSKYKEAFETIAMIHGVDGLVSQFLDLKELVDEKLEQESRKDKLVVGSKWECQANTFAPIYGKYVGMLFNGSFTAIGKSAVVEVLDVWEFHVNINVYGTKCRLATQQFLLCFKPKGDVER